MRRDTSSNTRGGGRVRMAPEEHCSRCEIRYTKWYNLTSFERGKLTDFCGFRGGCALPALGHHFPAELAERRGPAGAMSPLPAPRCCGRGGPSGPFYRRRGRRSGHAPAPRCSGRSDAHRHATSLAEGGGARRSCRAVQRAVPDRFNEPWRRAVASHRSPGAVRRAALARAAAERYQGDRERDHDLPRL